MQDVFYDLCFFSNLDWKPMLYGWLLFACSHLLLKSFEHMVEKTRDPLLISFPRSQLSRYFSPCMVLARKMTSYFERAVFPKPQRSSGNQSSDFRSTWTKQVAVNLRHVQICSILNTISRLKTIQRFQSSNTTHDTHRISSDTWCFANANSTICFNSEQIRSDANKRSILGSLGSRIKLFWHVLDAWRAGTTSRQQLLWISWISSHIRGLGVPRYPLSDG